MQQCIGVSIIRTYIRYTLPLAEELNNFSELIQHLYIKFRLFFLSLKKGVRGRSNIIMINLKSFY